MPYTYYDAYLKMAEATPKDTYLNDFQQLLLEQFDNASDVFTIQEETAFASFTYQNVDVRINHMIDAETGKNMSDDFKRILFKEIDHSVSLGSLYQFDDNYWIAFNIDKLKSLNATASVRRCNNTLRWLDTSGGYHSLPCNIDYLIKENRDYSTAGSSLVIPSGAIEVMTQFNAVSNLIRPNQRFLFGSPGNWTAYRVVGGGIGNFNNMKTADNTSQGLMRFTMDTSFINEALDDLVNGIADPFQYVYTITLNDHAVSGSIGGTVQLSAIVKLNGVTVTRNVEWVSSNTAIATVNSSGLVTYRANGSTTISCYLENSTVHDACTVTVAAVPANDFKVVITPVTPNYLYEGSVQTYSVYLYKNGVPEIDTFSFVVQGSSVPTANYTLTVLNGNQFRLTNNRMWLSDPLVIRCTPNFHAEYTTDLETLLKGAW